QVEVAVLLAAGEGAEGLAGDANRRRAVDLHDGEDATRVDVQADRDAVGAAVRDPEPRVPTGQVVAVEERRPRQGDRGGQDEPVHGAATVRGPAASATALTTASGRVSGTKWPVSGSSTSRAPGISDARRRSLSR